VFGGRARGTHRADGDADLAVILRGDSGARYGIAGDMAGIAFDVMPETGIVVDPPPLWKDELNRAESVRNPTLVAMIGREGLRL
jgi:predicted nucleotidyltransferase